MKKVLDFLKKHKIALIVIGVIIILIVLLYFSIKDVFFANISKSKYGNRLDGIESYPMTDSIVTDIKNAVSESEIVESIKYDLEGRIINFIINVKAETKLDDAKGLTAKIIEKLNEDYQAFYDIQVFLTCSDSENKDYPSLGYKHKTSKEFKWNVGLGDVNEE